MSRLASTFQNLAQNHKKAVIAYVCGDDPNPTLSLEVLKQLADCGVDIIEIGVPFSDPLADGIVNQMASERALKAGSNLPSILRLISNFRQSHDTPIVLFSYLNPIYSYGFEKFEQDAHAAGADGVLILDLTHDERRHNPNLSSGKLLDSICLIAPTTSHERIEAICRQGSGFIYALSRSGVTGVHGQPLANIDTQVANIKQHTSLPVCVGFGIGNAEQAGKVAQFADGVIVGSALVSVIAANAANGQQQLCQAVKQFIEPIVAAVKS